MARSRKRQSAIQAPCGWLPWCFSAPPTHREPQLPVRVYRRGRFEPDGYLGLICAHRPYQSSLCCLEPQGPRCEVRKRASRFGTVEASDTTLLGLAVTVRYSLINPHRFGGADKHQSRNAPGAWSGSCASAPSEKHEQCGFVSRNHDQCRSHDQSCRFSGHLCSSYTIN